MRDCVQYNLAHLSEKGLERRIVAEIGSHSDHVHEIADDTLKFSPTSTRDGSAF